MYALLTHGDARYRRGELLLATEGDFGPATEACRNRGKLTIASLEGSYNGEAWHSRPAQPFRLKTVGSWSPYAMEGSRPAGTDHRLADFCSAHYFDVRGSQVAYAWYGEGTRFLDVSNPVLPRQYAYWRPDDGIVWASYFRGRYIYTADRVRGVDVLRLTKGAQAARASGREVVAPPPSARQRRFIAQQRASAWADPATAGLCYLQSQ